VLEDRRSLGIQLFTSLCFNIASLFNKPKGVLIVLEPDPKSEIAFVSFGQPAHLRHRPKLGVKDRLHLLHDFLCLPVVAELYVVVFDVVLE